jgi:hypothetical protein
MTYLTSHHIEKGLPNGTCTGFPGETTESIETVPKGMHDRSDVTAQP